MHLREHFERADERDDEHEAGNRRNAGERDVRELDPRRSAVDIGSLVKLLGNALQAREDNNHLISRALPYGHEDNAEHRLRGVVQKSLRRNAERVQNEVEHAALLLVQNFKQEGNHRHGSDDGREVGELEDAVALVSLVYQKRKPERQNALNGHRNHHEKEGVCDCLAEQRILKNVGVIFKRELHGFGAEHIKIGKAEREAHDNRNDQKHDSEEHSGQHKEPTRTVDSFLP